MSPHTLNVGPHTLELNSSLFLSYVHVCTYMYMFLNSNYTKRTRHEILDRETGSQIDGHPDCRENPKPQTPNPKPFNAQQVEDLEEVAAQIVEKCGPKQISEVYGIEQGVIQAGDIR